MLGFLKKVFGPAYKFLFVKSPVFKTIISFAISLALFFVGDRTDIDMFWYIGLGFLGYTLIMFLIGIVYAWVINPVKDSRSTKKFWKVKKGKHYPKWRFPFKPMFYWKDKSIVRYIEFTDKSLFNFSGEDLYDYSKLFGISFGHHHKNESYRFGFRMLDDKNIDISLYTYTNGEREIEESIVKLDYDKEYKFAIDYNHKNKDVSFEIKEGKGSVIFTGKRKINKPKFWGYRLGLYIGGNNPAPNNIEIEIKKG